ncbi:MAG: type II toxin-antitoxin system RelE family toxin [Phycisphaerae bacterium]
MLYRMEVRLTREAAADLERLPMVMKKRIQAVISRVQRWPDVSGVKPLTGTLAGHYRIRTGDYRMQFVLRDNILWIEKIGHRDGFYED